MNGKRIRLGAATLVLTVLLLPVAVWAGGQTETEAQEAPAESAQSAKYVFLFIGDGMGMPQINAAEHYLAARKGQVSGQEYLSFSRFPAQAFTTTYANDRFITGSAASATAMATGYKTNIGVIAMDPGKTTKLKSIAEMAKESGKKVGIISSVSIDHATPAAFYAHQPSRSLYYQIDLDLANSGFDYFAGGGMRQKGRGENDPDALDVARQNGYKVVGTRSEFKQLSPEDGRVIAYNEVLKGGDSMPYELDRNPADISLAEYTRKGIEMLENEEGFFMMVEGGKIDWACHANDAAASIYDTLAFDKAVQEAVAFYNRHPRETLIVVTGDHECGGMTLGFAGSKYETSFDLISRQKRSATDYFAAEVVTELKEMGRQKAREQLMELVETHFGLVQLSSSEMEELEARADAGDDAASAMLKLSLNEYESEQIERAFVRSMGEKLERSPNEETYLLYGGYDPLAVTLSHILNQKAGIGWTSYKHTGVPVPTFAQGAGSEIFHGYYDNTDIAKKIMEVMRVEQMVATAR
jgi:alkaline phosphatase